VPAIPRVRPYVLLLRAVQRLIHFTHKVDAQHMEIFGRSRQWLAGSPAASIPLRLVVGRPLSAVEAAP